MKKYLFTLVFIFANMQACASDINYKVVNITDTRSTIEGSSKDLAIRIDVSGAGLKGAEEISLTIIKAVDDTGRDLINKDDLLSDDFIRVDGEQVPVWVYLNNPSRQAMTIKEMAGKLEVYYPSNDPESTVRVENIMNNLGKPVDNPVLRSAGIEITIFDKKTYDELSKKENTKGQIVTDIGQEMAKTMAGMFGSFSGDPGQNSIILKVNDPRMKIIDFKFCNLSGQEIVSNSYLRIDDEESYSFEKPVPDNAVLIVMLETEKSMKKIPIKFTDIRLP